VGNAKHTYIYKDKPLFGLDIGHGSLKVMQLEERAAGSKKLPKLLGFGATAFDGKAIDDGVIVDPETIAKALLDLFQHKLIGDISTRRVGLSIPSYRTYTRSINLPKLKAKELDEAVRAEAEQYVPVAIDELYLDYTHIRDNGDSVDVFLVAVPRKIVDSYMALTTIVGLEPVLIETTMNAAAQLASRDVHRDVPAMIIDFGSLSSDISLCENNKVLVMGTVQGGGESFTRAIKDKLDVSLEAAGIIKNKYGLGLSKKQAEITQALEPTLAPIIKEIHRMLRYYEERFGGGRPIGQVIILGGGANMPGLVDYLTNALRLPVRSGNPWHYIDHNRLQPPSNADKTMFATVAGLAGVNYREVLA